MEALQGLVMVVLIVVFLKKHRDISVDNYRNELFRIRHRLFMLATKSEDFGYDSEAYRYFETNINNSIRFAHKLDFIRLFVTSNIFKYKKIDTRYIESERKAILKAVKNQNTNKELKNIENEITNAMYKYFIKTSLTFKVMLVISLFKNSKIVEHEQVKTGMKNAKVFNVAEILATEERELKFA